MQEFIAIVEFKQVVCIFYRRLFNLIFLVKMYKERFVNQTKISDLFIHFQVDFLLKVSYPYIEQVY